MSLILSFSMTISILIIFMSHPLSMGACLLTQTILFTLMIGMISLTFWYSYIIFLMMISGMLILFLYMTSIASNEKFNMIKFKYMFLMFNFLFFIFFMLITSINYIDIMNYNIMINQEINLNKFFNMPYSMIMILMIIYLLITLIAVVKISDFNKGPLRQKF